MSTTRHLVNRRRRLATVAATAAPPRTTATPRPAPEPLTEAGDETEASTGTEPGTEPEPEGEPAHDDPPRRRLPRLRIRLPAVLCAATRAPRRLRRLVVHLGRRAARRAAPAEHGAHRHRRTSEVKGADHEAVGAVFSYDYASPGKSDHAARKHLTGKAVQQHKDMLAEVRAQAPKQKLVLTTTVTESGVEFLDGDRARLLVFADQSNTRTGKEEETTYAAAMFAVDAVRRGDTWRIAAIDTFTR